MGVRPKTKYFLGRNSCRPFPCRRYVCKYLKRKTQLQDYTNTRHQARSFKRKKLAGVQERCLGIGWEFAMFLLLKLRGKPPVQRPELGCRASPYNIGRPHPHTELVGLACKYRHRNTHKYKYKTNFKNTT